MDGGRVYNESESEQHKIKGRSGASYDVSLSRPSSRATNTAYLTTSLTFYLYIAQYFT